MTTNATPLRNEMVHQPHAGTGLALVRMTIGAMLVWVFFKNLGKGLYTPARLRRAHQLLHPAQSFACCVEGGHGAGGEPCRHGSPHASDNGNFARHPPDHRSVHSSGRFRGRFLDLGSLWVSEWGTAWIWELLVPVLASLGVLAGGRAGRTWGVDAWLCAATAVFALVVI